MVKSILVLTIALTGFSASAADVIFTKQVGAPITAEQAILASAEGTPVYGCELREMKLSKSGTSVSMRKKKKKLTADDAKAKIEEILKQRDQ